MKVPVMPIDHDLDIDAMRGPSRTHPDRDHQHPQQSQFGLPAATLTRLAQCFPRLRIGTVHRSIYCRTNRTPPGIQRRRQGGPAAFYQTLSGLQLRQGLADSGTALGWLALAPTIPNGNRCGG